MGRDGQANAPQEVGLRSVKGMSIWCNRNDAGAFALSGRAAFCCGVYGIPFALRRGPSQRGLFWQVGPYGRVASSGLREAPPSCKGFPALGLLCGVRSVEVIISNSS
jgi:hypothetical protein